MRTLRHVYQIVAAHLYRAESRSPVAEQAWLAASEGDAENADVPEEQVVAYIRSARTRAVAEIVNGNHPPSITDIAIHTLDHAIYTAVGDAWRERRQ